MATISCHSNQSSYSTGTTILLVPPAYRCYMWNMVRIGFMASEEMSFENVDGRWRRMPGCTISSPMSLRLRWANNLPLIFLYKNKDCGYSLESLRRGEATQYPQYRIYPNKCRGRLKKVKRGALIRNGRIPCGFSKTLGFFQKYGGVVTAQVLSMHYRHL